MRQLPRRRHENSFFVISGDIASEMTPLTQGTAERWACSLLSAIAAKGFADTLNSIIQRICFGVYWRID
jgi:hypothetical protein